MWPGRLLQKMLARKIQQQVGDLLEDATSGAMMASVLREMPLRAIALMGGGKLDWKTLDRMLGVMNRWPSWGKKRS